MKNWLTLAIASLLLILCVIEKGARYNVIDKGNVENMYNIPSENVQNILKSDGATEEVASFNTFLLDPSQMKFASDSSFASSTDQMGTQNLLSRPGTKTFSY